MAELRERFPGAQQSLESMYLAMTENPLAGGDPSDAQAPANSS
jgi:hypothetical protein